MSESRGFEPYLDWEKITDEMTDDLHEGLSFFHEAQDRFLENKTSKNAADMLRSHYEMSSIASDVKEAIYTQPMMVHIAGEVKVEENPENPLDEVTIQRCKRCGSVLQIYKEGLAQITESGPEPVTEDEVLWWDDGDVVAKTSDSTSIHMYQIEGQGKPARKLEKHEMECVSLEDLVGDFD